MRKAIGFLLLLFCLFFVFCFFEVSFKFLPKARPTLGNCRMLRGRSDYSWLDRRRHCTFTANFTAYLCPSALMANSICPECCQQNSVISFPPKRISLTLLYAFRLMEKKIGEQCITGEEKKLVQSTESRPKLRWSQRGLRWISCPAGEEWGCFILCWTGRSVVEFHHFSTLETLQGNKQI